MKCNDIGEHVTISATVLDGIREINRRLTMLERESIEISKQSTKAIKHQQHQARPEGRAK